MKGIYCLSIAVLFWLVLAISALAATTDGDIHGAGSEANPYRWSGGTIGVTSNCEVYIWNVRGAWIKAIGGDYYGSGSESDPFKRNNDEVRGLVCIEEGIDDVGAPVSVDTTEVKVKHWYEGNWHDIPESAAVARGESGASAAVEEGDEERTTIKVMTYNIRFACGSEAECDFSESDLLRQNRHDITVLFNQREPDVIALQAVQKSLDTGRHISENNLGYFTEQTNYVYGGIVTSVTTLYPEGTPIMGIQVSDLKNGREYDRRILTVNGQKFVIYNVHFKRPPFKNRVKNQQQDQPKDYNAAMAQVQHLSDLIKADMNANPNLPFIVMGDFNLDAHREEEAKLMQPLFSLLEDIKGEGDTEIDHTYPLMEYCEHEEEMNLRYGCFNEMERIDYILVSRNLQPINVGTEFTIASDHFVLWAELEYDSSVTTVDVVSESEGYGAGFEGSLGSYDSTQSGSVTFTSVSKKIDEVWSLKVGPKVRESGSTDIWDPFAGVWKKFTTVYPPPVSRTSGGRTAAGSATGASGISRSASLLGNEYNQYDNYIREAAQVFGVDASLIKGLIYAESTFNPNKGKGSGCDGLMQICQWNDWWPRISNELKGRYNLRNDPFDPKSNIFVGTRILKSHSSTVAGRCKSGNDQRKCDVAAYNFGPAVIKKAAQAFTGQPSWDELRKEITPQLLSGISSYKSWSKERRQAKVNNIDKYVDNIIGKYETYTPSVSDLCFPLTRESYRQINRNDWGNPRDDGNRCHAGNDFIQKFPGRVISIADGFVTNIIKGWYKCSSGFGANRMEKPVAAVLIYHPSLGVTVNYGEIDNDAVATGVQEGAPVRRGQYLGRASYCNTLHLEVYKGKVENTARWIPPDSAKPVSGKNVCARNHLGTKPPVLMDPGSLIKRFEGNYCSSADLVG